MTAAGESPIFAFLTKPSMVDYAGHMAGVFFVAGCNFRCGFCHNPDLLRQHQEGITWERMEEVCSGFAENWVDAAVITGGEPTLAGTLPDLIRWFGRFGWAIKLDSNGSRPDVLRQCLPLVNYVAMDIKTALSGYEQLTGFANVELVRASVDLIKEKAGDYEFRTTVIPSVHDEAAVREMGTLLRGAKRWILQPFVPKPDLPDPALRDKPRTQAEQLEAFRRVAAEYVPAVTVRG